MRERLTGYCHKLSAVTEWNILIILLCCLGL